MLWASSASRLSEQNWLDGFSYFEECYKKGFNVGDEFVVCNRNHKRLVKFKVRDIDSGFDGTLIDLPSSTYSAQTNTIAEKLRRKLTSVVYNKRKQIGEPVVILLDASLKDLLQKSALDFRQKVKVRESLTNFLSQGLYSDVIAFVMFERDLDGKKLGDVFVVSNPDSKVAKKDPVLFRKAVDIFG
ncbi:hypothetical protein GF359_02045 [candidate division WOR-3 bacterium]|uniref:Uncharacterized protein n=1 Tax=candidate division WOR-3 bacterium TaxID=2052148 RepID=A0A9D5K7W0_UNCW3|nr:hypothetical protein [candidate division WOR-3 bacterium]MBD3363976.1 hypothetical protein [candidate division WOR-3 bacterium]